MAEPSGQQVPGPARPAAEVKGVAAVIAGALVFYALLWVVSLITDALAPALRNADQTMSSTYLVAWVIGAAAASAVAVEVARAISRSFNRVGFLLLVLLPLIIFAVGFVIMVDSMPFGDLTGALSALVGTAIGLVLTFRDLWGKTA